MFRGIFGSKSAVAAPKSACPAGGETVTVDLFTDKTHDEQHTLFMAIKKCYDDVKMARYSNKDAKEVFVHIDAYHTFLDGVMVSGLRDKEVISEMETRRNGLDTLIKDSMLFSPQEKLIIRQYLHAGLRRAIHSLRESDKAKRTNTREVDRLRRLATRIEACITRKMRIRQMTREEAKIACEKEHINANSTNALNAAVSAYAKTRRGGRRSERRSERQNALHRKTRRKRANRRS
jgi:hypothetical protein